ncbi:LysR substrate-binding domain-containing protein [Variovorax sp. JS1663]|uniref:LysR substrate-binding domain-containing protein n=1 Tax=Variovorax sp. JS1663 TaxID=1851577 RepID=UPI001EDFE5BB|nr:LysR substrate-binding domain-containing protein [Variovorax sp. JS1663]
MKAHPRVRLVLTVSNRRVDPLEEPMDVVLRVRRPPFDDSSLVVRPLGRTQDVLMASPALLREHGEPASLAALASWSTLSLRAAPGGLTRAAFLQSRSQKSIRCFRNHWWLGSRSADSCHIR